MRILKRILKNILKVFLYFMFIPISYTIISLILINITVNKTELRVDNNKKVYLSSNGVHLNIIIPVNDLQLELKEGLKLAQDEKYVSFGWGDENFYLNTPTWSDLTLRNAFIALFLKSSTLIHLTRYKQIGKSWTEVVLSELELEKLNQFIAESFKKDVNGDIIIVVNSGYSINDDFYRANGSFSFLTTCNTWANKAFKESGLKACYWTPFDFGLINKYKI